MTTKISAFVFALAAISMTGFGPTQRTFADEPHLGYFKQLNDNTYILSLKRGAKLMQSLKAFQKATGVQSASVTGLGALRNAEVAQFRFIGESLVDGTKAEAPKFPALNSTVITGHREIVGLHCNLTTIKIDQAGVITPSDPHCHVALAGSETPASDSKNGYPVVGGHLFEAEVAVVAELTITTYPVSLNKKFDPYLNGFELDLDDTNGGIEIHY